MIIEDQFLKLTSLYLYFQSWGIFLYSIIKMGGTTAHDIHQMIGTIISL